MCLRLHVSSYQREAVKEGNSAHVRIIHGTSETSARNQHGKMSLISSQTSSVIKMSFEEKKHDWYLSKHFIVQLRTEENKVV